MPSLSVLAFVPAKMSSQRFPEKNMACLGGRPLLWYTLTVAFRTAGVDRVVVSSESQEILEFAARLGAAVRKRPPALSAPHVRNEMVVQDVLASEMETVGTPEYVLLLQPTHPLRDPRDIERGLAILRSHPDADCLFSVARDDGLLGEIDSDGRFVPEFPLPRNKARETTRYRNTGSFYIFRTAHTFARDRMFGEAIVPLVLEHPQFEVDVDYPSDLDLAEALLQANSGHFGHFFTDALT